MRIFFSALLLIIASFSKAQDSAKTLAVSKDSAKFSKVEIESDFPGGQAAWVRFLQSNLHYPKKAMRKNIEGDVVVQFIIDKDGTVSNIKAIRGPDEGGLKEEAERVITISGKWIPAVQNGRPVKSYKKQPIFFRLK
jgi:periplasmic protein TonB